MLFGFLVKICLADFEALERVREACGEIHVHSERDVFELVLDRVAVDFRAATRARSTDVHCRWRIGAR